MTLVALTNGSVDLDTGEVHLDDGREHRLTTLETALLAHLARRPGVDVDRDALVREVWGSAGASHRVVDFAVGRLRKKLGEPRHPRHVTTSHGYGYRFVPATAEPTPIPPMPDQVVPLATGRLHLGQRRFVSDRGTVALSALDARILAVLVGANGGLVPRDELARRVWGIGRHELALRAAISRLRTKLGDDPANPRVVDAPKGVGVRLLQVASARV
ncbi:MAG: winged helix-turn-helix domain-containing protein, partial [Myxococcota bacterium]